jgi:hypothetical protein
MNSTTTIRMNKNSALTKPQVQLIIDLSYPKNKNPRKDFNKLLLKALDSTFSVLGDSGKQAIYRNLKNKYGLTKEAIPNNTAKFVDAIEEVFGQAAVLLEARIIHALHNEVKDFVYFPGHDKISFAGYLGCLSNYCSL